MAAHVCPQTRTVGLSAITIIGIVPKIINYMSPFEDRWRQEVLDFLLICKSPDYIQLLFFVCKIMLPVHVVTFFILFKYSVNFSGWSNVCHRFDKKDSIRGNHLQIGVTCMYMKRGCRVVKLCIVVGK